MNSNAVLIMLLFYFFYILVSGVSGVRAVCAFSSIKFSNKNSIINLVFLSRFLHLGYGSDCISS